MQDERDYSQKQKLFAKQKYLNTVHVFSLSHRILRLVARTPQTAFTDDVDKGTKRIDLHLANKWYGHPQSASIMDSLFVEEMSIYTNSFDNDMETILVGAKIIRRLWLVHWEKNNYNNTYLIHEILTKINEVRDETLNGMGWMSLKHIKKMTTSPRIGD